MWLGGLAFSGVVIAHLLAFFLIAPDPHHRQELLATTGHGSWAGLVALALGVLVAVLAGVALRSATRGCDPQGLSVSSCAIRLVLLQTIAFTALEWGERMLQDGASLQMFQEPVFVIGLLVQGLVAIGAAILIVVFRKAVERIVAGRTFTPTPSAVPNRFHVVAVLTPRWLIASGGETLRGPPAGS